MANFDLLIIDDMNAWRDLIIEACDGIYSWDSAEDYDAAITKLREHQYEGICMNWQLGTVDAGRKLLTLLNVKYPNVPVLVISGVWAGAVGVFRNRYPNVQEVIIKVPKPSEDKSNFIDYLLQAVPGLFKSRISIPTQPALLDETESLADQNRVISWVHLSDLHIGSPKKQWDWEYLKGALLKDLTEHQNPTLFQSNRLAGITFKPDMIFVTGDIAYQALPEEYEEAQNLIESIWEITGLGKENTFIVPGNHDVNRSIVTNNMIYRSAFDQLANTGLSEEEWTRSQLGWWNQEELQILIRQKFGNYLTFVDRCATRYANALHYRVPVQIANVNVQIVGLNSAFISWKDDEDRERALWLGEQQVVDLESDQDDYDLRIALVHHPQEALHEHDIAWQYMEEQCALILHGHLHKQRAIPMGELERRHVCLPAGSVNEGGLWKSQRYSYGQLDVDSGKLDLYFRMTRPGRKPIYTRDVHTYADEGADGHIELTFHKA